MGQEKVALVTGSTDGIGYATARCLAKLGWRVLVHGRSADRCVLAADRIVRETGNTSVDQVEGDFSSLDEVRRLAGRVMACAPRLDVLINNAGIYMTSRRLSADGYEMTFAVNHLAPFLLTLLLLDLLRQTSPARVVIVSSAAHRSAILDFTNLQGEKRFSGYSAYALSKLGNIFFSCELAERLGGTGVTSNSLHPGVIDTKLLRTGFSARGSRTPEEGAVLPVELATNPRYEGVTGAYVVDGRVEQPSPLALDRSIREQFWSLSAMLCGLAS